MITLLLFTLVGAAFGYWKMRDAALGKMIFGMVGFTAGFFISFLILPEIFGDKSDFNHHKYEQNLVALNNSITSSGRFFLGSGALKVEKRYYYLVNTKKGVHSRSVDASDAYIVEHDSISSPKIVFHEFEEKTKLWYLPSRKMVDEVSNYLQFHIPEGSIKRQYNPN